MDTRFSSAIHTMILISESDQPMTSEQIAISVGTNASYIRKLTMLLKKGGLIHSHRGVRGFQLTKEPKEIRFYDIYKAVMENDGVHIFDIHQNSNDSCIVGSHIKPVLGGMFRNIEKEIEMELSSHTLEECMAEMRRKIEERGE